MTETKKQARERAEKKERERYSVSNPKTLTELLAHTGRRTVSAEFDSMEAFALATTYLSRANPASVSGVEFTDGSMLLLCVIEHGDYSELTPGEPAEVDYYILTPRPSTR